MMNFLQLYVGEIMTALIAGLVGWFFTRKKQKVDVTTTEIDNAAKMMQMYKDALDDLGDRYENKYNSVAKLYEDKETVLKMEVEYLKKELNLWKKKYNDLLREFNNYKKEHP
jgi:molecular chaperone GrpE (heat shock protein)